MYGKEVNEMKKNMIQFQKGLSMASFISRYGQESRCKEVASSGSRLNY